MSITDKQYLTLSNLSYTDLEGYEGKNIGYIIENLKINKGINIDHSWKANYDSIKDWNLVAFQNNNGLTGSGFAGCAFKSPSGEIVFAFRGTEPEKSKRQILATY